MARHCSCVLSGQLLLAALTAVTAAPIRVSCVGDSITAGVCAASDGGYPEILERELLPAGKFNVTGFGASGMTMLKKGRLGDAPPGSGSYWNTSAFERALASKPDIVTIMLGTNDAKTENWQAIQASGDSFVADFKAMIALFAALPTRPKVMLAVPPPLYPPFPYGMNATVINEIFPRLLRQLAMETLADDDVIDVFTALDGQTCITCDGCHPHGHRGYREVASAFAAALNPGRTRTPAAPPKPPPPVPAGRPMPPAGGVWLYQKSGNGSVFVAFADFYPKCGAGGTDAVLTWNGCYGLDGERGAIEFNNGGAVWSSAHGSYIGSYRVQGAVAVGVGNPCSPTSGNELTWLTAANGTVVATGEALYFETQVAAVWDPICCAPATELRKLWSHAPTTMR